MGVVSGFNKMQRTTSRMGYLKRCCMCFCVFVYTETPCIYVIPMKSPRLKSVTSALESSRTTPERHLLISHSFSSKTTERDLML